MINVLEKVINRQAKRMSLIDKALFLKNYLIDRLKSSQHCTEVEYGAAPNCAARLSISGALNETK